MVVLSQLLRSIIALYYGNLSTPRGESTLTLTQGQMHELSLSRNSAYSGPTECKHGDTSGIGSSIGSTIGLSEEDDDWPLIPLMRLSVLPSETLRRNITALDRLVAENEEMGFNEVELNEYIVKQRKRVVQELAIRDIKDSSGLATNERDRAEKGCNHNNPVVEKHWEVPVSVSNPVPFFHLNGGEKKITSQPACRGKRPPRRNRSTIRCQGQWQQGSSMAEQHHKIIKPTVATRVTTTVASSTSPAPIPAFVVASVGGKRRSKQGQLQRVLDEEIRRRTPVEAEAALRKERESLRGSRRRAALERLSTRRKERTAKKEQRKASQSNKTVVVQHKQNSDAGEHLQRTTQRQQNMRTGTSLSSTTPSDECVISDEKEDFESVSGDSINSNVEEDKRSTVGVNDEVKGDGLADVTVEEMSGSSDTSITLHHNHTEKTRNKDINGDKTYRTEDATILDERKGKRGPSNVLLKDNIATSGLEDQYNDAGSCNSPRFVVSNYYLSEEHIEEEEEKEVHLKAQRDSNIPSNISLEIISSDIKASSDGNMDETDEKEVICPTLPLLERATMAMTILPLTLSKIYSTFESVFTAHSTPRVVKEGQNRGHTWRQRQQQHRWLAKDITETLATQKRLYTEYFNVLKDYKMLFCNDGTEYDLDEGGLYDIERKLSSGAGGYWSGNSASRIVCVISQNQSEMCEICKDVLLRGTTSTTKPPPPQPSPPPVLHGSQDEIYDCFTAGGLGVWEELPSGLGLKMTWNLLWFRELVHKDRLKHNISQFTCHGGKVGYEWGSLMPTTFVLPHEYTLFVKAFLEIDANNSRNEQEKESNNLWIMKPVARSRGRGIKIVNDFGSVRYSEKVIIQRYIHKPFLLNRFARFSTERYTVKVEDHDNLFVHLTNSSIRQHNLYNLGEDEGTRISNDNPLREAEQSEEAAGTKTTLSFLWRKLQDEGITVSTLWKDICKVVIKALLCTEPKITNQPNAFELFGFDILVNEDLRPWLLEVNYSPDMARRSGIEKKIKEAVIRDTFRIVDPLPFDRDALLRIVTRRLDELRGKCRRQVVNCSTDILEADLKNILRGARPRRYGEMPAECGGFERICPGTDIFERYVGIRERAGLGPQQ